MGLVIEMAESEKLFQTGNSISSDYEESSHGQHVEPSHEPAPYCLRLRHDLANRLQAVRTWIDLISKHPDKAPGDLKIEKLRQSVEKLEDFAQLACTLVKFEAMEPLNLTHMNLGLVFEHAEDLFSPVLAAKGQTISLLEGANLVSVEVNSHPLLANAISHAWRALSELAEEGAELVTRVVVLADKGMVEIDMLVDGLEIPYSILCPIADSPGASVVSNGKQALNAQFAVTIATKIADLLQAPFSSLYISESKATVFRIQLELGIKMR